MSKLGCKRTCLRVLWACGFLMWAAVVVKACNIPVFRYALERWRPDVSQFVVFHRGQLDEDTATQLDQFKKRLSTEGANVQLVLVDLSGDKNNDEPHRQLWDGLSLNERQLELPYVLVRLPHARGPLNAWHGSLKTALQSALAESPVRSELSKRLLSGDSIVWLMVRSPDEARNERVRKMVKEQCQVLSSKIQLPEGIGLPGSELFSEVPLFLKFSLLEIDANDPREQFLLKVFENFQADAFRQGEPILIPVFGRGRALEVIPADGVDELLIGDLTAFLCGACSCQVKEQNPGFDLLLSANWDRELFGENAPLPPPAKSAGEGDRQPVLLTIPPGK